MAKITPDIVKQFVAIKGYSFDSLTKNTKTVEFWRKDNKGVFIPFWRKSIKVKNLESILPKELIQEFLIFCGENT